MMDGIVSNQQKRNFENHGEEINVSPSESSVFLDYADPSADERFLGASHLGTTEASADANMTRKSFRDASELAHELTADIDMHSVKAERSYGHFDSEVIELEDPVRRTSPSDEVGYEKRLQDLLLEETFAEPGQYAVEQSASAREPRILQLGQSHASEEIPVAASAEYSEEVLADNPLVYHGLDDASLQYWDAPEEELFSLADLFARTSATELPVKRVSFHFAAVSAVALLFAGTLVFTGNAFAVKEKVFTSAEHAVTSLKNALSFAQDADIRGTRHALKAVESHLTEAQKELDTIGELAIAIAEYVPGASKLASGDALIDAGILLSRGSDEIAAIAEDFLVLQKNLDGAAITEEKVSFLPIIDKTFDHVDTAHSAYSEALGKLDTVRDDDLPDDIHDRYSVLKRTLPDVIEALDETRALREPVENAFGKNGPRKFLFLFHNNQEMRATGGFIGSYGRADVSGGSIQNFFIDGIYNPDGQLDDKIVPPLPIQKISAAWSLHDSNWWPDFPMSAQKAMDFYERTGGPSVDGVIMMTPTVVEKLLRITGPIHMPAYDVTLDADNFIELTQYKVEIDYDKAENRPKKILSDLMPELMTRLRRDLTSERVLAVMEILSESLAQRHVMLYMKDDALQELIDQRHWGGRVLETDYDYLSVINTNINGFKTDGIVEQEIAHDVNIARNGRITNTVTITRKHNGGHTGREWWDAVNANYMRVYVPQGSRLLRVEGHTHEINEPRLNYDELGFLRDADVVAEEGSIEIWNDTSTRVYDQFGKTVFANWVYVSPQETVRVTYEYELPWRITYGSDEEGLFGAYGILYQKQAGSTNSTLKSTLSFPDGAQKVWSYPHGDNVILSDELYEGALTRDLYRGTVYRVP